MTRFNSGIWLKTAGTGREPVEAEWLRHRPDLLRRVGFADRGRPTVEEYDFLALYLAGRQKIVGAYVVTSDPIHDPTKIKSDPPGRWPWYVTVIPLLLVPNADYAPHLRDVGINTLSVRSQSHISIDRETWMRIVGGLANAASIGDEHYVAAYRTMAATG